MIKIIPLIIFIFSYQFLYSQTEQDYFEKLRLERKAKKVKTISTYGSIDNVLWNKEYCDVNGYLTKKEIYYQDKESNKLSLFQEINITSYDASGNISGVDKLFESGRKINEFPFTNMSYTYFYEIGFDENLIDDIKYVFDKNGNLIEKRFTSEDMYKPGIYEKEILIYDSNNFLIESEYSYPDNSRIMTTKYYYNSSGLLAREERSNNMKPESCVVKYEYEFY